jgi:hypothetical protein
VCCCFTRFCTQMSIGEAFGVERLPTLWREFFCYIMLGCAFCNEMDMCSF